MLPRQSSPRCRHTSPAAHIKTQPGMKRDMWRYFLTHTAHWENSCDNNVNASTSRATVHPGVMLSSLTLIEAELSRSKPTATVEVNAQSTFSTGGFFLSTVTVIYGWNSPCMPNTVYARVFYIPWWCTCTYAAKKSIYSGWKQGFFWHPQHQWRTLLC